MSVAIRCRIHPARTISSIRKGLLLSKLDVVPKSCCPYLLTQREVTVRTITTASSLSSSFGGKDGKGGMDNHMSSGLGSDRKSGNGLENAKCPKCKALCPVVGPRVECPMCKHRFVADVEEVAEQQSVQKNALTPKEIYKYLSRHVIGQSDALQIMSTSIYNHCKKVTYNLKMKAASQPQQRPTDMTLHDTTPKNLHYREMPISMRHQMFASDLGPSSPPASEAPVFNFKLLNSTPGEMQHIQKSNLIMVGPTGSGKTLLAQSIANLLDVPFHIADCTSLTQAGYVGEDVENIIARLFQNANYDVGKCEQGIIVLDEVDKIATRQEGLRGSKLRDIAGEGVQQSLLKMIEGTTINVSDKYHKSGAKETIDTSNILFIACGAFNTLDQVVSRRTREQSVGFGINKPKDKTKQARNEPPSGDTTEAKNKESDFLLKQVTSLDIVSFGFLPEFVGRFAGIVPFHTLTKDNLVQILVESENSYIKEFTLLFSLDKCKLVVEHGALGAIAENCLENKMGARGLRQELETHLKTPMFEVPGSDIITVIISESVVRDGAPPKYVRLGDVDEPAKKSIQLSNF